MARTRDQWNSEIETFAATNGLSISSSAEWLLLRDLCVTIAMILEGIFELLFADINDRLANKHAGTIRQLPDVIKAFQYGHDLVIDANGVLGYETIDTDAQIITQRSVRKTKGQVNIKVAKAAGQLNTDERNALNDYLDEYIAPGIDWGLTSLPADVVKYILTVEYNTLYDKTALLATVQTALDDFRDNFTFDAIFRKAALIAAIKAVPGVVDVVLRIDMTLDDGATTVTDLEQKQELPAGWFTYDGTSTITAIAA